MLGAILGWLGPNIIGSITGPFLEAYKARLESANTQDAKAVELAVKAIEAEIAARAEGTKLMIAEQGRWWTAAPRALVCWSFSLFVAKAVVWDTMLGWGHTPALQGDVAAWAGMVMITWFGGRSLEKIVGSVAGRFNKK